MIVMKISPEIHAKHFKPAPDYLVIQRHLVDFGKIGRIHLPDNIKESFVKFITVGKVVAVSDLESSDPYVEYLKGEIRKSGYVGFSFHVTAECPLLPQFEFDNNQSIVMIHVKDVVQIIDDFDGLMKMYQEYSKDVEDESVKAAERLDAERGKLVRLE